MLDFVTFGKTKFFIKKVLASKQPTQNCCTTEQMDVNFQLSITFYSVTRQLVKNDCLLNKMSLYLFLKKDIFATTLFPTMD